MPEVILKQDIYRLGERGEVVRVADGYARNYLFPKGLAIPADKGSLKQLDAMRAAAAREAVRVRGDAEKQLDALDGQVVRLIARASLNNQLYGSVTARDIAQKLADLGIEVDRHRIQLTTPIRAVGDYEIPIHIYRELSSTLKVEVRAQGREDEPINRTLGLAAELEFAPAPTPEVGEESEAEAGSDADATEEAVAAGEMNDGDGEEEQPPPDPDAPSAADKELPEVVAAGPQDDEGGE